MPSLVELLQPAAQLRHEVALLALQELGHGAAQARAAGEGVLGHAEAKLRVVLEERVVPRRAPAVRVARAVRRAAVGVAPDGGAAGGVRDDHAVAKHLRQKLDVGRLATTGAGSRELEQRLLHLRALHRCPLHQVFWDGQGTKEIPVLLVPKLHRLLLPHHAQRIIGARLHAHLAAGAIARGDLDAEVVTSLFRRCGLSGLERCWRPVIGVLVDEEWPNHRMRADVGAVVALGALVHVHLRHLAGLQLLLVVAQAHGRDTAHWEGGHRNLVTAEHDHGTLNLLDEWVSVALVLQRLWQWLVHKVCPSVLGVLDLDEVRHGILDRLQVLLDDEVAVLLVGLLDCPLEVGHRLLHGQHVGQVEEGCLHDVVRQLAQAALLRHPACVDGVELDVLLSNGPLRRCRKISLEAL
mmetsp:Transcript_115823/g.307981  ORF Transcript_115823/g.307981 Transcript_115823/m.307981 type:complete len:409 (-) Transcript_115823:1498-2724(-)